MLTIWHCPHLPATRCCCWAPAMQQSIDISYPLGPQQQTCSRRFAAVGPCWDRQVDRQVDTVSFRIPCSHSMRARPIIDQTIKNKRWRVLAMEKGCTIIKRASKMYNNGTFNQGRIRESLSVQVVQKNKSSKTLIQYQLEVSIQAVCLCTYTAVAEKTNSIDNKTDTHLDQQSLAYQHVHSAVEVPQSLVSVTMWKTSYDWRQQWQPMRRLQTLHAALLAIVAHLLQQYSFHSIYLFQGNP